MLVIRLARGGRTKYPVYRIVAAESSRASTGKFVEILGQYNPHTKELSLDKEQIARRLGHGAQPSNSVAKLLKREGVKLPEWVKLETKNKAPKKEPVVKEAAPVAAEASTEEPVAEEVAEAPAEETVVESPAQERVAEVATENAAEVAENAEPPAEDQPATETTEAA